MAGRRDRLWSNVFVPDLGDPSVWVFFTVLTVAVGLGTFVQASLGFGLNLVVSPIALLVSPQLVPVAILILNVALSALIAVRGIRAIERRFFLIATAASIPGVLLGQYLNGAVAPRTLGIAAAVVILMAVGVQLLPLRIPSNAGVTVTVTSGAIAGVLAATTAITGPPIALALTEHPVESRRATVAATGITFTLIVIAGVVVVEPDDLVGHASLTVSLLPGLALGLASHALAGKKVPRHWQRTAILVVSALAAIALLIRATSG